MGRHRPLALLAAMAMLVAGCATAPEGRAPAAADTGTRPKSVTIDYHVYQKITQYGGELPGYGMYTYVLFPHKAPAGSALAQRYRRLSAVIEAGTMSAAEAEAAGLMPADGNLFCLPDGAGSAPLVLSLRLMEHLRGAGPRARALLPRDRPGPFLVSLPVPVRQVSGPVPMLVADLSRAHADAFPEIVATYRHRLSHGAIDKAASFTSLRLQLLNLFLIANDDLSVIKVALAAWSGT